MEERESLGLQFKRIHDLFEANMNRRLKGESLTLSQLGVLRYLYHHEGERVYQKDLERYLSLSHPTVIGILQRMEQKGFVRTAVDEEDRRCRAVVLTEKSRVIEERMEAQKAENDHRLTNGMTEREAEELRRFLKLVQKNLETP